MKGWELRFLALLVFARAQEEGQYEGLIEGDMLLSNEQKYALYNTDINTRNGLLDPTMRWPNATVVYYIKEKNFGKGELKTIKNAMAEIMDKSCVTFRLREDEDEHAVIIQSTSNGCFSTVGVSSPSEMQGLNLGKGCVTHGIAVHEMLHTLGFYHMHNTYNRDDYVTIMWDNIQQGSKHNFKKYDNDTVTNFGVTYDYGSVMHYPKKGFSRNGKDTIVPKQKNVTIGQRNGLSEKDILKLNRMYCEDTMTLEID